MSSLSPNDDSFLSNDTATSTATAAAPIMLGKFRLISVLGKGSMGKVIRAEDSRLKRHVALKCLKKTAGPATYRSEQFLREARAASALEHPSIVQIYEVGETPQYHYIAMELIEGGSLGALIKACGPLDLLRAAQLTAEAAEALAYAAQLGIVHRDIKPENLMLTRSGRCKITDFGLARIDDPNDSFEMPHGTVGTLHYMAPESVQGFPATGKSDVYSLACVLFYLLAARPPFQSKDREELLKLHAQSPAPDLRTLRPDLPESISKILARALAKNPDDRPSADAFSKQLRAHTIPIGAGSSFWPSPTSPFLTTPPPTPAPPQKNWLLYTALATVAALLVLCIALFVMYTNRPQGAVAQPPAALPAPAAIAPSTPQPPAPAAPPAAPAPIAAAPATTDDSISAADRPALLAAAKANQKVTIRCVPLKVDLDPDSKIATISFRDNPDFKVTYAGRLYNSMSKKFGGKDGTGILNKPLLLTGYPTLTNNQIQLLLTTTSQINLAN